MESDSHMPLGLYNCTPVFIEGMSPQLLSESQFRTALFQPSNQNDKMIGFPEAHRFQDLHFDKTVSYDGVYYRENFNHQDLNNSLVPPQVDIPPESSQRAMYSSSSVPSSLSCDYDFLVSDINNKWDQNKILMHPELDWRPPTSNMELQGANEWGSIRSTDVCTGQAYGTLTSQNELCLSLATNGEQCSEIGYSGIFDSSQSFQSQRRLGIEHCSERPERNRELSLSRASSSQSAQFSQLISGSGSRYRAVLQQILSEVASFSLDSVDRTNFSGCNLLSSSPSAPFSLDQFGTAYEFLDIDTSIEAPGGSSRSKQKLETTKSQLLSMLQVVDDQYNRCLDQIHTVISAFHAASDLDPQLHACFALQSVSFFYKNLRQRISNQILEIGLDSDVGDDSRTSFEKSFIQKQWAIQQLKKKKQQLWRPQRGLPERSVSVLRAWMFDNFLHPYPKDSEKHLLAIKSGLSRSQVSNWFINARVRLWKPLVEEMCSELNRRKGSRQIDEESSDHNNRSSQLSICEFNQRFDV